MARIQKTRVAFQKSGSLDSVPPNPSSTDWAAVASVLRAASDDDTQFTAEARAQLQDALRRVLPLPLDLCLDYRRIVFDLVGIAVERRDFFAAVEAQQWWIDFLDDFGKAFGLRVDAIRRLHELRVLAGQAEPTEEACQALIRSYVPAAPGRAALIKKSGA